MELTVVLSTFEILSDCEINVTLNFFQDLFETSYVKHVLSNLRKYPHLNTSAFGSTTD